MSVGTKIKRMQKQSVPFYNRKNFPLYSLEPHMADLPPSERRQSKYPRIGFL
jgi:hypothetical protein